jgi:hypothetical protein
VFVPRGAREGRHYFNALHRRGMSDHGDAMRFTSASS